MSIINNINVGVGNSNPSYHLDVSGHCHVTGNSYTLGNVGIGTTNPLYNLDVNGTTHSDQFNIFSNTETLTTLNGNALQINALTGIIHNINGIEISRINATSLGIGKTPSYPLDVNGNCNFSGTIYNGSSIIKQITNQIFNSTLNVNQAYQNPNPTPMFVTAVIVGNNQSYGVNSDSTTNPTTQIFNQTLAGGNGYCFFIVMPYNYFKFTGNISLGQVFFYY